MAGKSYQLIVDAVYKGAGAFKKASADVKELDANAKKGASGFKTAMGALGIGATAGVAALGALSIAAKVAWDSIGQGAELNALAGRFDNLAASINSTGDAMLGKLREATGGMMSDAALMASATDIMALGLGKTEEQTIRLAEVVGKLGWDMQQVVLTMANNSKMRLDALGLSLEDVNARVAKLRESGMSLDEAFDLAVIEAGEAKILLYGDAADTTAGKIKILQASLENAKNAFSQAFAGGVADHISEMAGGTAAMGDNLERAALGAAKFAAAITNPVLDFFAEAGRWAELDQLSQEYIALGGNIKDVKAAMHGFGSAPEAVTAGLEFLNEEIAAMEDAVNRANPELRQSAAAMEAVAAGSKSAGVPLSEWTDEAKKAAIAAAELGGELAGIDWASVAGGNQEGIWRAAGTHIQGILDEAAAEAAEASQKAADELAAEIASAYEEAGRRMGQAFAGFTSDPSSMPDFGDAEGMAAAAWDMASAFGLTVEQAGNLGIALGQFEPELAEAAAKAVIFQEAFGNLLGQFQTGNLDTTGFMTAYDQLISDMQNKSLIEIQVDLKMPERVPTGQNAISPYLPDFSSEPIEVPISIVPAPTAADNALSTALAQIDGIPAEQEKHITFSATYSAVTPTATDAIQTAINAIESEVDFIPNTSLVDAEIARIDQSHITVYVGYVTTGSPPEGKASGGPVRGGVPYKVGEVGPELFIPWTDGSIVPNSRISRMGGDSGGGGGLNVSMSVNFYGPAEPAGVQRAIRDGMGQFYADIEREGVAW